MKSEDAAANLMRWQRWAAGVAARWDASSPLAQLAKRRLIEAELQLLEERERERSQG